MNLKKLHYKKKCYIIQIQQKKYRIVSKYLRLSLLEILLLNNVDVSYQCRNGYCGICKIQLINGTIKYFQKNIIAYIPPKYILSCCCIINSDINILI